jgi:signal transduction histidine kinase
MNWTAEVAVFALSVPIQICSFLLMFRIYRTSRNRFYGILMMIYLIGVGYMVCGTLGYLFLSRELFTLQALIAIPLVVLNVAAIDTLRRYAIDPVKMFAAGVVSCGLVLSFLDPNSIVLTQLPYGGSTLKAAGFLEFWGSLMVIGIQGAFFVFTVLIYRVSTQEVRKWAAVTLVGGTIYGLIPAAAYVLALTRYLPGVVGICAAAGSLIIASSFTKCPDLHMVLLKASERARVRYLREQVLLHDLLNTVSALSSSMEIFQAFPDQADKQKYLDNIREGIDYLSEEIRHQQKIIMAEQGLLTVKPEAVTSVPLLVELTERLEAYATVRGKAIQMEPDSVNFSIVTDRLLLRRIVYNMIKNAIEAGGTSSTVRIGSAVDEKGSREIWVHNDEYIPMQIQEGIFSASVSSKGDRRGFGTYSMKLLSRSIRAEVGFRSTPSEGTRFYVRLPADLPTS